MIIIGIDPGIEKIGYGIIEKHNLKKEDPEVLDYGCITTSRFLKKEERLKKISLDITRLLKKYKPGIMAVESLFFFKNLKTAISVSEAKGVILLAAASHKIPVQEFTPLQVKMTVVGYGRAEKKQVQEMVKKCLNLKNFNKKEKDREKDDAADALGIALCVFFNNRLLDLK
ncbi:MAG: crossover junction endodeoxyribonuclease RuvC [Candidatus Staskawiczbacteria bacterium]|nr:crossover junction endodeoxyribonuclease RuvC [Candidatus Staskawiczbacteria bacterium]